MAMAIGLVGSGHGAEVAAISGDRVYLLAALASAAHGHAPELPRDLPGVLAGGDRIVDWVEEAVSRAQTRGMEPDRVGTAGLRAPITMANVVVCLADVFISHLIRGNNEIPDAVGVFYKLTQDVIGPGEDIVIPRNWAGKRLVSGTELTLVIGRQGRYITPEQAWDHVWGYTILNDVTLKQMQPNLGTTNKVFESSAPIGPYIVPKRYVPNPRSLQLLMRINGQEVQNGTTADMRFDMADSLAEVSNWRTLNPGDMIATADVGSTDWLNPGDDVECEVEGVGVLRNAVRQD